MPNIEFVSYTGKYPNLCSGVLTLNINKKEYIFGHDYIKGNWSTDGHYESFWYTSGGCGFRGNDYSDSYIEHDAWGISEEKLPEELKEFSQEIIDCFNENVEYGCCGGCI